jgi:SAM-dependent methyltransferase
MHHLPADLQVIALDEMRRVLRPGGTLLIAEAYVPRALGWQLLARLHGYDRMAQALPALDRTLAQAGFDLIQTGVAPPWLRFARGVKK